MKIKNKSHERNEKYEKKIIKLLSNMKLTHNSTQKKLEKN